MKRKNRNNSAAVLSVIICVVLLCAATVASTMIVSSKTGARYNKVLQTVKSGYIADETYYVFNSVDIIDQEETNALVEQARGEVLPVFIFDVEDDETILASFESFRNSVDNSGNRIMALSYEVLYQILAKGYYSLSEINDMIKQGYTEIRTINIPDSSVEYEEIVSLSSLLTSENIDEFIISSIKDYSDKLDTVETMAIFSVVKYCLIENVHYDRVMTTYYRDVAASQVLPVIRSFTKGDVIIPVDTVINDSQISTLKMLSDNEAVHLVDYYSETLLVLIGYLATVIAVFWSAKSVSKHPFSYLFTVCISVIIEFATATFLILTFPDNTLKSTIIFYPICFAPMLITAVSGKRRLGVITSAMVGLGLSIAPGASIYTFFYALAIGCTSSYMVRIMNKRLDAVYQFALTVLSNMGITAFFVLLQANAIDNIIQLILIAAARTGISTILVVSIVPIIERVLNLPTVFRLHELSFTDSPLLIRLSQVAPGTFSHSRQVADLAAAAAEEVGANAAITRVGALYHDIGKMDHPEYFVENQSGSSKHDELNPTLSASIIRNHVKSGAEKGREAGLPAEIIDIIANHHGNDVIRYFYYEAANEKKEENRYVEEQDFRYNAEPPSTKECAIVMLADSIEAAARTIQEPTPAKFSKLIRTIILQKIEHNQLDRCDLSMKDLDKISKSFLKTVTALYHSRIQYPDEDEH